MIYLVLALLVWNFTSLGRLASLVYAYVVFGGYIAYAAFIWLYEGDTPLNVTPLAVSIAIFHVTAAIPVIVYLQPKRQKKLFNVSLLDLLLSSD